jgi:hypothetical protein
MVQSWTIIDILSAMSNNYKHYSGSIWDNKLPHWWSVPRG